METIEFKIFNKTRAGFECEGTYKGIEFQLNYEFDWNMSFIYEPTLVWIDKEKYSLPVNFQRDVFDLCVEKYYTFEPDVPYLPIETDIPTLVDVNNLSEIETENRRLKYKIRKVIKLFENDKTHMAKLIRQILNDKAL